MAYRLPPCRNEKDFFDGDFMDDLIFDDDTRTYMTRRHYFGYDRIEILEALHKRCLEEKLETTQKVAVELEKLRKEKERDDDFWKRMKADLELSRAKQSNDFWEGVQADLALCRAKNNINK